MRQLVQLNKAYPEIQELGGELLAIHLECIPAGSEVAKKKAKLEFHLANDDRLQVSTAYSPTSAYLVGLDGRIKARWLGAVHDRVNGQAIIEAMREE
jgi:peroxiredoxin